MSTHIARPDEIAIAQIIEAGIERLLSGNAVANVENFQNMKALGALDSFKLAYLDTLAKLRQGYELQQPCFNAICPHCQPDGYKAASHVLDKEIVDSMRSLIGACAVALEPLYLNSKPREVSPELWRAVLSATEELRGFVNKYASRLKADEPERF